MNLAVYVQTSDLPATWYTNTDYTIPIHTSTDINPVDSVQVKVSIPEEGFATNYTTGAIGNGGMDTHNVTINVPASGPATLTLAVRTPAGYADVDPSNNKVTISIDVQPKP